MPEAPDPRRAAFTVPVRPAPGTATQPQPALRGVEGPPPPKPGPVTVPVDQPAEVGDSGSAPPVRIPPLVEPTPRSPADKPGPKRKGRADNKTHGDDARDFGTRRGNLVYIQTALSPTLADALHQRAQAEDVVLGEVLMAAVRTLIDGKDGPPPAKRRRRGGNPVRKDIGLLPNEAADIYQAATDAGYLPSAFMRLALEHYLNQGTSK